MLRAINGSIFAKYFFACASIIVVSFLTLGTTLVVFTVNYSNSEKINLYKQNTQKLAGMIVDSVNAGYTRNQAKVQATISAFASALDAYIYFTDSDGDLLMLADKSGKIYITPAAKVPSAVMNDLKKANIDMPYSNIGTMGDLFDSQYINAGVPIDDENGKMQYAVFISSSASSFLRFVYNMFRIFIVCVCVVLLLSFAAVYFVTARMVRPLRQMGDAAKSFAKGDFSARIPVRDNDEIGQLAASFNNMAASLTSLEDMRRSFVANVSHELKTPMTSIAGFIDGILDGTIPREKEAYYLKIVSDEVKRLSRLVRSFLDIARIEAGELKINPAEFDVMETIRIVVIGFEHQIDEKRLDIRGIDSDDKIMVSADPDLTHQIIYNLVENAVKFAEPGGYIEIKAAVNSGKKKVYAGVKNSGMGIPSAELPYVFDRFYKTDKSRSRDRKGVGLGLYIVKTVLNMQGEDIVVRSAEGEFCEFVFTLKKV